MSASSRRAARRELEAARLLGTGRVHRRRGERAPDLPRVELPSGEALIVEVKTRAAHAQVGGYHAVKRGKKRALARAARAYVAQLPERPRTVRFDVVEVEHIDGAIGAIRHFENVPLFPKGYLMRS